MDKSLKIYEKEIQILLSLPKDNLTDIVIALLKSSLEEEVPELDPMNNAVYELINSQITRAKELSAKRADNGKKGMSERWENNKSITNDNKPIANDNTNTITITNTITDNATATLSRIAEAAAEKSPDVENEDEPETQTSNKSDPTPYKKIMEIYNNTCVKLPKIQIIDGERKKAVKARYKSYNSDLGIFRTLFEKAESSAFMTGGGSKNWIANFDFLMTPDGMTKTLEGKYDNKNQDIINGRDSPPLQPNQPTPGVLQANAELTPELAEELKRLEEEMSETLLQKKIREAKEKIYANSKV